MDEGRIAVRGIHCHRVIGGAVLEERRIPISASAWHVHLTRAHVEALFGADHRLTPKADLTQPCQFACVEVVALVGPRGRIERVRVLGP